MFVVCQINLDSATRELTAARMSSPDRSTFEIAQKRIQALMAKDSYPRFLRSDVYRQQLEALKVNISLLSLQPKT
jgi:regulator of G-protein signaling